MAALVGLILSPLAHGGLGGAIVEASAAILIAALALAVWLRGRAEKDPEEE